MSPSDRLCRQAPNVEGNQSCAIGPHHLEGRSNRALLRLKLIPFPFLACRAFVHPTRRVCPCWQRYERLKVFDFKAMKPREIPETLSVIDADGDL
jgi:hypothetical protein